MSAWHRRDALFALLLLGVLAALTTLAERMHAAIAINVSREVPEALSARLLRLAAPLEVTAYAREDRNLRGAISQFFARFDGAKLRFVNPDADPESARRLGVRVNGEMRLQAGTRSVRLVTLSDAALARAIDQLTRSSERLIGVLDLNQSAPRHAAFLKQLADDAAQVIALDLDKGGIPVNLSVLLLLGSERGLDAGGSFELQRFVESGGKLLWLLDPPAHDPDALLLRDPLAPGLNELALSLGLRVSATRLQDGSAKRAGLTDPAILVIDAARVALSPALNRPAYLIGASGLYLTPKARWQTSVLIAPAQDAAPAQNARTMTISSAETPALGLGFQHAGEARVVVVGDQDFLSDAYIGMGANLALGEKLLDLLDPLGPAHSAPIEAPDARFELTKTRGLILSGWLLLVLPGALLVLAALTALRRRAL